MAAEDLIYDEQCLTAIHAGNLDPEGWAHSRIMALGLSGQRNPLGAAILHWLDSESAGSAFIARFLLSTELVKQRVCRNRDAVDIAHDAMSWYLHRHCPTCQGRGVLNFEQDQCPVCVGTGTRAKPNHKETEQAISILVASLEYLDNQIHARLRGAAGKPQEVVYVVLGEVRGVRMSAPSIDDMEG